MTITKRFNLVGAILLILTVVLLALKINFANAQDNQTNAITLSVSPPLLEVTANPGEKFTNTFKLTNSSDVAVEIRAVPTNFTPNGEEGAVNLTEEKTTYAISEWTKVVPESSSIGPDSSANFEVTIDVPSNAEPGSHFGAIVFQTIPPKNDSAAALISQEVAPVVLVKLAGDIVETSEIVEFSTSKKWWTTEKSVDFISRIENTGTAHFKPTGQIVIKNIFGTEVAKFDLDKNNVLPGYIRKFENNWTNFGFQFGSYTAELTVVSGEDNQIVTAKTSFYIFPYQQILPLLMLFLILAFVLFKGRKRIKLAARALSGKETEN